MGVSTRPTAKETAFLGKGRTLIDGSLIDSELNWRRTEKRSPAQAFFLHDANPTAARGDRIFGPLLWGSW
jgi:hypothetical protein